MTPTIERAAIMISTGNYRRATEALLQIIIDQEKRISALENRDSGGNSFTDGLECQECHDTGLVEDTNTGGVKPCDCRPLQDPNDDDMYDAVRRIRYPDEPIYKEPR